MVLGDFHPPPRRNNLARHSYLKKGRTSGFTRWALFPRAEAKLEIFGLDVFGEDCLLCTTNLTSHFVGGYRYDITPLDGGLVEFSIRDSKSTYSLFAHQLAAMRRVSPWGPGYDQLYLHQPFRTTWQRYWWREHLHP